MLKYNLIDRLNETLKTVEVLEEHEKIDFNNFDYNSSSIVQALFQKEPSPSRYNLEESHFKNLSKYLIKE